MTDSETPKPAMLQVTQLHKSFYDPGRGEVKAVDGLNLRADDGVVALVGANGAGKTTFLRLVSALLRPDSGSIAVAGSDTQTDAAGVRRKLGYLSPSTRLYERLTAREQLAYAAGFHGIHGAELEAGIERMTELFGLHEIIDHPCGKLSTGQGQRVNLARTLLPDPPLLVLDEPTTGLDVVAARSVVDAVQTAKKPGRLILFCTHIMAEVEAVADRLLILRSAQVVFDDVPGQLGSGHAFAKSVFAHIDGSEVPL